MMLQWDQTTTENDNSPFYYNTLLYFWNNIIYQSRHENGKHSSLN